MFSTATVRAALVIALVAMIGGIMFLLSRGGSRQPRQEPPANNFTQHADVALRNARFSEMRSGKVEWELVAEQAEYDKGGEVAQLSGIRMVYYRAASDGTITLTSDRGEYSTKSKNVKLRGKVHVATSDGAEFDTEALDYDAAGAKFTSTARVAFRQERLAVTAVGMLMRVREHTVTFRQNVDAQLAGEYVGAAGQAGQR